MTQVGPRLAYLPSCQPSALEKTCRVAYRQGPHSSWANRDNFRSRSEELPPSEGLFRNYGLLVWPKAQTLNECGSSYFLFAPSLVLFVCLFLAGWLVGFFGSLLPLTSWWYNSVWVWRPDKGLGVGEGCWWYIHNLWCLTLKVQESQAVQFLLWHRGIGGVSAAPEVPSLAWHSELKDPSLLQLRHRLQPWLRSDPSPGTSMCHEAVKKKKKKKKKKKRITSIDVWEWSWIFQLKQKHEAALKSAVDWCSGPHPAIPLSMGLELIIQHHLKQDRSHSHSLWDPWHQNPQCPEASCAFVFHWELLGSDLLHLLAVMIWMMLIPGGDKTISSVSFSQSLDCMSLCFSPLLALVISGYGYVFIVQVRVIPVM